MLKQFTGFLLAAFLSFCLLCAVAEPRYPQQNGDITDIAAVLSPATVEDLHTLNKRLDKADTIRLIVVTVDFLDGASIQRYADELFNRWRLDNDDLLLLMAVGEDLAALCPGKDVTEQISGTALNALLKTSFIELFLQQQYDAAIGSFVSALVPSVNKAFREDVQLDGLFGQSSTNLMSDWAARLGLSNRAEGNEEASFFARVDRQTGFSFLKVLLIIAVLMLVFGSRRKKYTAGKQAHQGIWFGRRR